MPPNGRQKKSPRKAWIIGGSEGSAGSSAHGATEQGWNFRPSRSNVTGPKCPPNCVTNASTSGEAKRQEGWPWTILVALRADDADFMVPQVSPNSTACRVFLLPRRLESSTHQCRHLSCAGRGWRCACPAWRFAGLTLIRECVAWPPIVMCWALRSCPLPAAALSAFSFATPSGLGRISDGRTDRSHSG